MDKGFNMRSEKQNLILKKNTSITKLEEHLDHGNGSGYLLATRLNASPKDAGENALGREESKRENILKAKKD